MSYDLQYGEFRNKPLAYLRNNDPDYGDADYMAGRWPQTFGFVRYTSYDESLHSGSPSDKANYEFWKETYDKTEGKTWWDLGHSGGIFVRIPFLTKDERESYEYLEGEGYVLDEDREQKIRSELETEAWDDYGRKDYKKAIIDGVSEEEHDTVEELLDAITDGGFDAASFDMWSRSGHYPEVSGWEVTIPDADNLLQHDENFTDYSIEGVINWLGIGHEVTVRLSPKAFCRLHPEDREFNYPGAVYTRYGEEWVLNIDVDEIVNSIPQPALGTFARGAPIDLGALELLIQKHLDETARFIGIDQAPSVTMMFSSQLCQSPYLICAIDYIEESKLRILQGPSVAWDEEHVITDEELKDQAKFDEKMTMVRNLAIEGAIEVCDIDPTPDLVEQVVESLFLDAPDRQVSTLERPPMQEFIKKQACDITRKLLESRPPMCTIRQLKLPGVRERKRSKRA